MNNTLTAIHGIRVGHAQDLDAMTGCTVIICPPNTVGGVDQRGGAPATRETDLLRPMHMVQHVNAVLLTGGSAFGLAAADGVMRYLEEHSVGLQTPEGVVPIVPAAGLYDLNIGKSSVRPDAAMGYTACQTATSDAIAQGSIGVGAGAKVGSLMGTALSTKSGIGSAAVLLENGLLVAALIAVNALGDVVNERGEIIAGLHAAPDSDQFIGTMNMLRMMSGTTLPASGNTIIGVVATNAKLSKDDANKVAQMAHDGIAQAVRPAHTMYDGDTLFALATGEVAGDVNIIGAFTADMVAAAIRNVFVQSQLLS